MTDWKPFPGLEDKYEISSDFRLRKTKDETMAKVKQLEWVEYEENWLAAGSQELGLGYEARETPRGGVRMRMPMGNFEAFDGTLEEAKAAAQADFERRILSVIE